MRAVSGQIRLPRLRMLGSPGGIGDVRGVVLIAQPGEMMTKFMHENVLCKSCINGRRGLVVEDPAAAVLLLVDQNLQEVVRSRRGGVAQSAVVQRQHVALGIEDVVL